MRKGCFGLSQLVRDEMNENPLDGNNVYIFLSKSLKVVKILHYERGFFVLYEKRPLQGKFKSPYLTSCLKNIKSVGRTWSALLNAL